MMTSNRPLEDWGKLIGDVPSATAILDRFLHHAEIIRITGKSYRLRGHARQATTDEDQERNEDQERDEEQDGAKPAKAPIGSAEAAGDSKPAKAPIGKSVSGGRHTTKKKPAPPTH
jgi:hypothetical protein